MTAIVLALVALGLLQLDGRRVNPLTVIAAFVMLAAVAVAFNDQAALL